MAQQKAKRFYAGAKWARGEDLGNAGEPELVGGASLSGLGNWRAFDFDSEYSKGLDYK